MQRRSLVAIFALMVSLAAVRADAVTVRDVIELSKAGLSDPVLLTLIDVDKSVFSIDTATLKQLKAAGVSDAVIVAMIRSGHEPQVSAPAQPVQREPEPAPEAIEPSEPIPAPAPAPVPYPVAVPVPVYIAVPVVPTRADARRATRHGAPADVPPNCLTAQVPHWGFGGSTMPQPTSVCR